MRRDIGKTRAEQLGEAGSLSKCGFRVRIPAMPAPPLDAANKPALGPRYHPLVIVLVAAAAGIIFDRHWPLRVEAWWVLAAGGLTAWTAIRLGRQLYCRLLPAAPTRDVSASDFLVSLAGNVALLLAVAAAAGAWHHCRWNLFAADDLGLFARRKAEPACFEAVAVERPRELPPSVESWSSLKGSRLLVDLIALRDGAEWRPVSGRATLLVHGEPPKVEAGDRLRCFARLSAPSVPFNPGSFDRATWHRSDRILSRLHAKVPQCVSVIAPGNWWGVGRFLDRVRARGNLLLTTNISPQYAGLAAAVLLGQREQLEYGQKESFVLTGTVHLLVISGLHLGILAGALFWLVRRTPLPRNWGFAVVAAIIVFYMLLVDAGPPVVRATVLVLVICAAAYLGRQPLSFNSLAAAALIVLALNPCDLFRVGAQLSFLSVAGLMFWAHHWIFTRGRKDVLDKLIEENSLWVQRFYWTGKRTFRRLLLVGLMLWLLNMPLVMARFHLCSPAAVLLNTVAWIPMACGLMGGFALLLFGGIFSPLGALLGRFCDLNLWLLEWLVDTARQAPLSHFWVPGPEDWWLWGFYGGLGVLAAFPRLRPPRRWCVGLLAVWIAVGFSAAERRAAHDRLDCTFLGVGHGCAVLLELPSGQTMLYDAGRLGSSKSGARTISEFLWHQGLTHLDAVVISHPDADHFNALPELLERFSVGVVYVSPIMFEEEGDLLAVLRDALDRHDVVVREIHAGDRLQGGGECSIEVLHPPRRGILGSNNANSLVLAVECFGQRILLPGDLESPGLNDLLAEEPMRCEVLLAPHHGSRKSNSPELAAWCRPRWVVLSGGGRWNRPDIEATYRAVGGRVLPTSDRGAIRARITAEGIQMSGFVEPPSSSPPRRSTTISPGARKRGWRKITRNRPGNASMISHSCRSVAMTYERPGLARKSASSFSAASRSPSQRVTGRPA